MRITAQVYDNLSRAEYNDSWKVNCDRGKCSSPYYSEEPYEVPFTDEYARKGLRYMSVKANSPKRK